MVGLSREVLNLTDGLDDFVGEHCGALVSFFGVVRNRHNGKSVDCIDYECHESMCLKMMHKIEDEVGRKWPDVSLVLIHRIGMVKLGEASILVHCASPHRKDSYEASQYVMNRVKEILPIWKREFHPDGKTSWVGLGS